MKDSTTKGLAGFQRHTLPYSKTLTAAGLERWLSHLAALRKTARERPPDLPHHSGPLTPLSYQQEVIDRAFQVFSRGGAALLSLPTGAGKTFVAIQVVLRALEAGAKHVLWLAPQRVLLEQAVTELRRAWWSHWRGVDVRLHERLPGLEAVSRQPDECVFITSTLQAAARDLDALDKLPPIALVVVDECHYLEANVFGGVLSRLRAETGAAVLGLTATPGRARYGEMDALLEHFDRQLLLPEELGTEPVRELQRRKVYSRLSYVKLQPTFELDTETIARMQRVRNTRQRVFAHSPGRLDAIVQALEGRSAVDQTIIFCYSIAHSHVVAAALHAHGHRVGILGSEFGDTHNATVLREFGKRRINVLVNAKYAAIGTDLPSANLAILTTPVGSPIFFEQVVGRIARGPAVGGTEEATLMDFDNNPALHDGVKSYARFLHEWD